MHIDNGLAALELFEEWFQHGVAEIHTVGVREEYNPIKPQGVVCVRQLFERRIDVGQRDAMRNFQIGPARTGRVRPRIRCTAELKTEPFRYPQGALRACSPTARQRRYRRRP